MPSLGAVLWGLGSLALLGSLVAYMMWRSWQSAHHTKQMAQGRRPIANTKGAADGDGDGEKVHS
jgi:hypothetical protein